MNKYIYQGHAIFASSRKEAIKKIMSNKVVATASQPVKDWINRVFAGLLSSFINSEAEEKVFNMSAQEISSVLVKYLAWNDSEKEFYIVAPFLINKLTGIGSDLKTFDAFIEFIKKEAFKEVAKQYDLIANQIYKILIKYLEESDISIKEMIVERLCDNVDVDYNLEKYYELKFKRKLSIELTNPEVMIGLFGTQDIAKIADKFVKKELNDVTYDAIKSCVYKDDKNSNLSFESVVLFLYKEISSLYLVWYEELTLKQILSTTDVESTLAINKLTITKNSYTKLMLDKPFRLLVPVKLNKDVTISSNEFIVC